MATVNGFVGICDPTRICELCGHPLGAICVRCGGVACAIDDHCHGCQQIVCEGCNSEPTPPFSFPGDHYVHPHNGPLRRVPYRMPSRLARIFGHHHA